MPLNKIQKSLVNRQLRNHRHTNYVVDIHLGKQTVLKNFIVLQNVFRPDKTASLFLAKFLYLHNNLFLNKTVIDMGTGSGIQGIVVSLYGARQVIFSDISNFAIQNVRANIQRFRLNGKYKARQGNLFENINSKADLIIFNHPFFPGKPRPEVPVATAMLDDGILLRKFFQQAKKYLNKNGKIIMPFFHLAGDINNPKIQGSKYGYRTTLKAQTHMASGLQKGLVSIFQLE